MRKLMVFNSVSLDGYFTGRDGDLSWAHKNDPEWTEFTNSNASGDSVLLFGRVTYDMMRSFWPTPAATKTMPEVAAKMNKATKFVFSRSLSDASWQNTHVISHDIAGAVRKLKSEQGPPMVMMGSGSIVAQLTAELLVDEYQIVTVPVILGEGRSMFEGVPNVLELEKKDTRTFSNGNVVSWYETKT